MPHGLTGRGHVHVVPVHIYMCTYLTLCVHDGSPDSDGKPGRARANPFCECCTVLSTYVIELV